MSNCSLIYTVGGYNESEGTMVMLNFWENCWISGSTRVLYRLSNLSS